MIRILLVNSFKSMGGSEKTTLSFIRKLDGREYETLVACSQKADSEFCRLAKSENIRCFPVRLTQIFESLNLIHFPKFLFNEFMLFIQLARVIRRYSIHMIQVHSLSECLQAIPVSFIKRKPLIWIVQEGQPLRKIPRLFFAVLSRFVFRFVPVSRYVARNIRILGIPRNKIQQITIGIPAEVHEGYEDPAFRRVLGISEGERSLALVIKGENRHIFDALIQAMRLVHMQFERVKFFICAGGQIEFRRILKKITDSNLHPNIQIVETYQNFSQIMKGMDLLIHVGVREPFPIEVLEAMSAGVAVVANKSGAMPELVVDRKTGILVPPQDARSLAKAITELLSDAPLREQMGREGRKRVLSYFRVENQLAAMKSVYRQAQARERQLSPNL